ncbi:MAG: hypothetical protein R3A51_13765 [Nannocystaceae bacterium]
MPPRFTRIVHRAHDVDAARAFYAAVLGEEPAAQLEVVLVPKAAAARGAPAHWLGAIGVDDVDDALAQLCARGATQLGPRCDDGRGVFVTVRDGGGALLALTSTATASGPAVAWSHLDARDAAATFAGYAAIFGWRTTGRLDLGPAGEVTRFAWRAGGPSVGSYADVAARPGVHPQWLFHLPVSSLHAAQATVRARGGVVLADVTTPGGRAC